jgi:hypothetical protein
MKYLATPIFIPYQLKVSMLSGTLAQMGKPVYYMYTVKSIR